MFEKLSYSVQINNGGLSHGSSFHLHYITATHLPTLQVLPLLRLSLRITHSKISFLKFFLLHYNTPDFHLYYFLTSANTLRAPHNPQSSSLSSLLVHLPHLAPLSSQQKLDPEEALSFLPWLACFTLHPFTVLTCHLDYFYFVFFLTKYYVLLQKIIKHYETCMNLCLLILNQDFNIPIWMSHQCPKCCVNKTKLLLLSLVLVIGVTSVPVTKP